MTLKQSIAILIFLLIGMYCIYSVTKKEAQSHYDLGVNDGKQSLYNTIQEMVNVSDNIDTVELVKDGKVFVKER